MQQFNRVVLYMVAFNSSIFFAVMRIVFTSVKMCRNVRVFSLIYNASSVSEAQREIVALGKNIAVSKYILKSGCSYKI